MIRLGIFILLYILAAPAQAKLEIFTCEPEWSALARELAGPDAAIYSATSAMQDPHRVEARPSLIARIRNADLLICSGAGLEDGWLPLLLRRSGNSRLTPGKPGYFLTSDQVQRLEIPARVSRAEGDIHPQGNPHVHLDPRNITRISTLLAGILGELDPGHNEMYQQHLTDFLTRWDSATVRWKQEAAALQGKGLITHHKSFSYLINWLGLRSIGTIEPKPGIAPSSSHLTELLHLMETEKPIAIIRTPYVDAKPSEWLAGKTSVPVIVLPYTAAPGHTATDLFQLFDHSIQLLLDTLKTK
jgi:zinc/manganese transport system substrate-binding protein